MFDKVPAALAGCKAQRARLQVQVIDDAIVQRALRLANSCAVMADGAGREQALFKKAHRSKTRFVLADTRIIEDAEQGPHRQRIARRAESTMRSAHRHAAFVLWAKLGD